MSEIQESKEGYGRVIGKRAQDFTLSAHDGSKFTLSVACKESPLLLVFYPGDFTPVCTRQLCNYRDNLSDFNRQGIKIVGISSNSSADHNRFAKKYDFPFVLLSDPNKRIAKLYDCTTWTMLGMVSRAVFIINRNMMILYQYIEPTTLTMRPGNELVKIVGELERLKLL